MDRIERQLERLRSYLAAAWQARRGPDVIGRLEQMIRRRWKLRDSIECHATKPQPE